MAVHDTYEMANRRAGMLRAGVPHALSAGYDPGSGQVVIKLSSGLTLSFPARAAQGLEHATPSQLGEIEISPSGYGLYFPGLDADIYLPSLLEGFLGSRNWMAARLGKIGGQARSRAKKAASRANGRLGGRPKQAVRR